MAHEIEAQRPGEPAALEVAAPLARAPAAVERVLIHVTSDPATAMIIRRGWRVASYLCAECFAVYVRQGATPESEAERHLAFARSLRVETHTLASGDAARALVEFAHAHGVTQIFLARPGPAGTRRSLAAEVVRRARAMQGIIVAERRPG